MKRLILSLVLVIPFMTLSAQTDSSQIQLGIKGGANFAKITGDDIGDVKSRSSFNAGFLLEIPISDKISIQPELIYSGQGFDIQENDEDNPFDNDENIEYQLDYIQIPVLLKVYLVNGLSVEAGPQFGFKVNEEIDFAPTNDGGDIDISNEDSNVKGFDTNLALGASYKFDGGFFVNARYNVGLTNIFEDDSVLGGIDARNDVWQFGLGFMF